MQLNKLQIFKTVYECGNTADAAHLLNVSRPAVSQSLSKLEKEMGVQLFTRLPKGLIPTPLGHRLAQNVSPLLDRIQSEMQFVSQEHRETGGVLYIGAPQTTGTVHMPKILDQFTNAYPNCEIHLKLRESSHLLRDLLAGKLDLAILDLYGGLKLEKNIETSCHIETLFEETVVLCCSTQYFEDRIGDSLDFENMISLDYLAMEADHLGLKSWFLNQYGKAPQQLKKRVVADNGVALLECALNGMGLVLHGSNITQRYVKTGRLVEVTPTIRGEKNKISLVRLLDKKPTSLEKRFIETLKQYTATMKA